MECGREAAAHRWASDRKRRTARRPCCQCGSPWKSGATSSARQRRLAVFCEDLKHHPLPRGWLPKVPKADAMAREALLPSEEAKLLAGRDKDGKVVVPLAFRVLYAFLHREGMRKGEARALDWTCLDLDRGIVSLDENKTDRPRSWVLDGPTLRVLAAWHELSDKPTAGRVFEAIGRDAWARLALLYRSHCEAAGIDRARLFERKANKLRLRAHDMRAFFVTAAMYAGKDALWITDRTGHTSLGMLRTYERDVRRWRELGESPVDADVAIPAIAAAITAAIAAAKSSDRQRGWGVSSGKRKQRAGVAEWQTQRTQNPPSERT
jgi:integrase